MSRKSARVMIHRKSQLSVPKTRNPYIRHSIYCKPYDILVSVEVTQLHPCMWGVSRRFQAIPGGALLEARGLQGPPGPRRAARTPKTSRNVVLNGKCALPRIPKAPNLGRAEACLQRGRRGFLKGSERPEAGCLGELG